ncbi:MAG: prepilin peptidase [Lachnospiraceae bacterium]|nr:prepilin peptidase [Lachnospiraceae bacterium]
MWIEILLFLFLGICAVFDGIAKRIPLIVIWLGIITAIVLHAQGVMGDESWSDTGMAVLPGMLFWMLSFITREKVGYGDGWMLVMIGLFTGLWKCFLILLVGLVSESLVVLVLLTIRRVSKDCQIPFAPFLLFGMGVVVCF